VEKLLYRNCHSHQPRFIMPASKKNILIEQGATFLWDFFASDKNGPIDLSGASVRMHVRELVESPSTLLELTTDNGRITLTPLTGHVSLEVSATDTSALAFEGGVYDLEIQHANGTVWRVYYGSVKLSKEVTRA
jgi:hypothetical protein